MTHIANISVANVLFINAINPVFSVMEYVEIKYISVEYMKMLSF